MQAAETEGASLQAAILAQLAEGVIVTDATGRITFVNESAARIHGVAELGVEPDGYSDTYHLFTEDGRPFPPEDLPLTRALRGETVLDAHWRIQRPDGTSVLAIGSARPIRDASGAQIAAVLTVRDDTDRDAAERQLRENEATLDRRVAERTSERNLLATLVETTDVMVMACDLDYNILATNKANADEFERVYGVRPTAGDNLLTLLAEQPDHQAEVKATWARALDGQEMTVVEEFGDADRDRPIYAISFRTLKDEQGERFGAYQFVTDTTERLQAEARLVEAQEALRQSQKMEAMGQLTGGVAHDFNNLLTPIVGTLDLLQRNGLGDAREQRLIAGAAQSAERAKVLVQRLLAFARRQPLQPVAVDLAKLVTNMAELVSSTTGPQIKVVVDTAADLPPAKADPNQLEMAFLNLTVNARDAMPDGGTLRISTSAQMVRRGTKPQLRPGQYLRVSVADTGIGMDKATLSRAAEPFFSTKGVGKGTGLGLSMAHGLAAQLGGGLFISSEPGLGTCVELCLPASEGFAPQPAVGGQPGPPLAAGTALVVDDEEIVRSSTAEMIAGLGYTVVEAASAEEALQLIDKGLALSLLVTDHLMPGLSGTELARKVRRRHPDTAVLVVSGYAEVDDLAADLPRLAKPYRQAELAAKLADLNQGRHR